MADDKSKRGGNDRSQVAADEPYEVDYFARKHGISHEEAQGLIERVGNDRAKLDAAVTDRSGSEDGAAAKPRRAPRSKAASKTTDTRGAKTGTTRAKVAPSKSPVERAIEAVVPAAAAERVTQAVVEPVAEIVAPVTRQAKAAATKAVKTAKRGSAAAAKVPGAARKSAGSALENVKSKRSGRTASVVGAVAAGVVTGLMMNLGRKAVVQAPSTLAGDWFEAVKLEHKLALALFDKLQATGNHNTTQRTVLLTQLKHALGKHAFTEENVLYPALRAWGDTADADKLNHDHGYVKQYLYDLEQLDNAAPVFLEKVAEFRAQIEEHIREEEESIFPPLHAALGDAANAKVTALANKEGFKLA